MDCSCKDELQAERLQLIANNCERNADPVTREAFTLCLGQPWHLPCYLIDVVARIPRFTRGEE